MGFIEEDCFAQWRDELYADPEIAQFEREQRSLAFVRMYKLLKLCNPNKEKALFFRTVTPELEPRSVLIIDQSSNKHHAADVRVLINEVCLTPNDITKRVVEGNSFQIRSSGKLITQVSCTLPENHDGGWKIGQAGFLLQKKVDYPLTHIRHGLDFHADSLCDTPQSGPAVLAGRRQAIDSLHGILVGLDGVQPEIAEYLFGAVLPQSSPS
jgi:hypothetical protein